MTDEIHLNAEAAQVRGLGCPRGVLLWDRAVHDGKVRPAVRPRAVAGTVVK